MKNYLEYKNYIGTIEFSADDKIFYGKIQGINDVVTFEGASVKELEKSFKEAVNDYLETCKALSKEPDKVYKGTFNVRVSQEMHRQVAVLAYKSGLNLNDVNLKALSFIVSNDHIIRKESA